MTSPQEIRHPVAGGIFYPSDPETLKETIISLLEEAGALPSVRRAGKSAAESPAGPIMLLLPHAAYEYVGSHLAAAFSVLRSALEARTAESFDGVPPFPERVFLAATVHRDQSEHIYLPETSFFRSPLGDIEIDLRMLDHLTEGRPFFRRDDLPFREEFSLELALPFLTQLFPNTKIVPILLGSNSMELSRKFLKALKGCLGDIPGTDLDAPVFIVSSNLCPFTSPEVGREQTERLLELLEHYSPEKFDAAYEGGRIGACGRGPLRSVLGFLGEEARPLKLLSGTSGAIAPQQREIWYGSFICRAGKHRRSKS